jgi:hypothetical protein
MVIDTSTSTLAAARWPISPAPIDAVCRPSERLRGSQD